MAQVLLGGFEAGGNITAEGLSDQQRRHLLGQCIDMNLLTWLLQTLSPISAPPVCPPKQSNPANPGSPTETSPSPTLSLSPSVPAANSAPHAFLPAPAPPLFLSRGRASSIPPASVPSQTGGGGGGGGGNRQQQLTGVPMQLTVSPPPPLVSWCLGVLRGTRLMSGCIQMGPSRTQTRPADLRGCSSPPCLWPHNPHQRHWSGGAQHNPVG